MLVYKYIKSLLIKFYLIQVVSVNLIFTLKIKFTFKYVRKTWSPDMRMIHFIVVSFGSI